MEFLARVNSRYFAAIKLFASEKDVRYYLHGVCIERHPDQGVILIATNGHILAAIHDPDGWLAEGRDSMIVGGIQKSLISACTARTKKACLGVKDLWIAERCAVVTLQGTEGEPEPFGTGTTANEKIELIDAKFPDWQKAAVPGELAPVKRFPNINGKYLARFAEAAVVLLGERTSRMYGCALDIQPTAQDGKIIVRIPSELLVDRFIGVIMPLRADIIPKTLMPSWLPQPKPARMQYRGEQKVEGVKP